MSRERQTNSKALDEGGLPKRVLELERQVADLEMGLAMQASGGEKALITALSTRCQGKRAPANSERRVGGPRCRAGGTRHRPPSTPSPG